MRAVPNVWRVLCAGLIPFFAAPCGGGDAVPDRLQALRGNPAVVEIPALEDFGLPLRVPEGWGYLQASSETVDELRGLLRLPQAPALACLDRYGNVLFRDSGDGCRRRIRAAVTEFERRRRELEERIRDLGAQAAEARQSGRPEKETARVLELAGAGVRGYREVEAAILRVSELDRERWQDYLRALAGEGIEPAARFTSDLRALEVRARGLPVAARIRRDLDRLERGVRVRDRP